MAAPVGSSKGTNIVPHGERWQVPVILSLAESSGAKGVDFHGADGPPAEEVPPEDAAAGSGEEGELPQAVRKALEKCHAIK